MGVKPHAVTLHIEELVLSGFPAGSRHAIADAMRTELARLIRDRGIGDVLTHGGSYDELRGGAFTLAPRGPQASGSAIAERLYTTLSQEGGGTNGPR